MKNSLKLPQLHADSELFAENVSSAVIISQNLSPRTFNGSEILLPRSNINDYSPTSVNR